MNKFHYIITGAGCAGLSLLVRLIQSGQLAGKKLLLIDKAEKSSNDRTWCFWEKEPGLFEPVVFHRWKQLHVFGNNYQALHNIDPYEYKMIRGADFYQYCFEIIRQCPEVTILQGEVSCIANFKGGVTVQVEGEQFYADYVFNSILFRKPPVSGKQYYLLQHFKGWVIETGQPVFDPEKATLMDFRVNQQHGTTFVYVMPFSPTRALVEYTLFSPGLLPQPAYSKGLQDYIRQHITQQPYCVEEEEFGVIPMTNYHFPAREGAIIYIGTAGGQTKASSGYTFQFIQKQAAQLVQALAATGKPFPKQKPAIDRFRLYDSTLLNILHHKAASGADIFTKLFRHNKATEVLQFLDNDTSLLQEMKIIRVLPKRKFLKAALQQLF